MARQTYKSVTWKGNVFDTMGDVEGYFGIDNWDRGSVDNGVMFKEGAVWYVTHVPSHTVLMDSELGGFPEKEQAEYYRDFLGTIPIDWSHKEQEYYYSTVMIPDDNGEVELRKFPTMEEAMKALGGELEKDAMSLFEYIMTAYNHIYMKQHEIPQNNVIH